MYACPQASGGPTAVPETVDATQEGSPLVEMVHPSINDV